MDYDLFEDTFYHTQHSPQGESVNDDLSWLLHPIHLVVINMEPTQQVVGETTDVVSENIVSSLQDSPVATNEHPKPQEVSSEHSSIDTDNNSIDTVIVSIPNRYELPPRSIRGDPPK